MIVFLFTITMIFPAGQSYLNFEGMIELGLKRGENETEERDLQALETIAVRSHWGIENRLHWRRNVTLREDESRVRQGHADENLAVLRHISLNLLRQEQSSRVGIHAKRRQRLVGTTIIFSAFSMG